MSERPKMGNKQRQRCEGVCFCCSDHILRRSALTLLASPYGSQRCFATQVGNIGARVTIQLGGQHRKRFTRGWIVRVAQHATSVHEQNGQTGRLVRRRDLERNEQHTESRAGASVSKMPPLVDLAA